MDLAWAEKTARESAPIPDGLDAATHAVGELSELVSMFAKRLDPVLRPEGPDMEGRMLNPEPSPRSEVAGRIASLASEIGIQRERLAQLLSRVEL